MVMGEPRTKLSKVRRLIHTSTIYADDAISRMSSSNRLLRT